MIGEGFVIREQIAGGNIYIKKGDIVKMIVENADSVREVGRITARNDGVLSTYTIDPTYKE